MKIVLIHVVDGSISRLYRIHETALRTADWKYPNFPKVGDGETFEIDLGGTGWIYEFDNVVQYLYFGDYSCSSHSVERDILCHTETFRLASFLGMGFLKFRCCAKIRNIVKEIKDNREVYIIRGLVDSEKGGTQGFSSTLFFALTSCYTPMTVKTSAKAMASETSAISPLRQFLTNKMAGTAEEPVMVGFPDKNGDTAISVDNGIFTTEAGAYYVSEDDADYPNHMNDGELDDEHGDSDSSDSGRATDEEEERFELLDEETEDLKMLKRILLDIVATLWDALKRDEIWNAQRIFVKFPDLAAELMQRLRSAS